VSDLLSVAAIQLNSRSDVAANQESALSLIERAAGAGARFLVTPEYTSYLGRSAGLRAAATSIPGPGTEPFAAAARRLAVHLLVGLVESGAPGGRCWNTSVLFGPDGSVRATYRKIHLFDVSTGPVNERESADIAPGDALTIGDVAGHRAGLTICYDVRFPELYRGLVERGAELLCVPAAFTAHTGRAHWDPLLRARAIESQCFVVAAAQWGTHDGGRCFGHSQIIDPWGETLAELPAEGDGYAIAELDFDRLRAIRRELPSLANRRLGLPEAAVGE
jgi:deaminated glutathione amidase